MTAPDKKWLCIICGFIYDEAKGWPRDGIAPGTRWEDVPDDWVCPDCLVGKADFEMVPLPAAPAPPNTMTNQDAANMGQVPLATHVLESNNVAASDGSVDEPLVIIGSGYGGYNLAEAVRQVDANRKIVVLTQDDGMHYAKPSLSLGLSKAQNANDLINERPLDLANRLNIHIVTHCHVQAIDTDSECVETDLGTQPYGQLVLATGATPAKPPLEGTGIDHVLCVNDLTDYRIYYDALASAVVSASKAGTSKHATSQRSTAPTVVLIGNGLIGCEFANDLVSAGFKVHVVGLTSWPMDRLLPQEIGNILQDNLAAQGVTWHLDNTVSRVDLMSSDAAAKPLRLTLANGEELLADLVVSAIGLQARTELAHKAGIGTATAITVDAYMETSQAGVYALGDCVEIQGQHLPYISPIYWSIQALSKTLTGNPTTVDLPLMTVLVKTPACPLTLLPPPRNVGGQWQIETSPQGTIGRYVDQQQQLRGFVLQGDTVSQRHELLAQVVP